MDYSEYRHGSARWANARDIQRAGLFAPSLQAGKGSYLGEFAGRNLNLNSDAPWLLVGGSGTGKLATVLGVNAIFSAGRRNCWVDPKGEIAAITLDGLVRWGKGGYCINPLEAHGLPQHTISPLSFLKKGSVSLTSDIMMLVADLIEVHSADNPFFGKRARAWLAAFIKYDVLTHGVASLLRVREALQIMLNKGSDEWEALARRMAQSVPEIRTVILEILTMQGDDGRAYGIIMADLNTALMFLDDPAIRNTLADEPDLDLETYVTGARDNDIFFIIPPEVMSYWAPFIRMVVSAMMIIKRRFPASKRINFYVDEAGQLGRAEFLPLAMTFGRGAGIKTCVVYQGIGQMVENFGASMTETFIGSAQVRQMIGTRDPRTAQMLSDMAGSATIEYFDDARRARIEQEAKRAVFNAMMSGDNPVAAAVDARQMRAQLNVGERMARALITSDEVLAMGKDEQMLFISDIDCPVIRGQRRPYFEMKEASGFYMPNPYHPPYDTIKIRSSIWGMTTRRILTKPLPGKYAHLPQYKGRSSWRYVEGFEPR